MKWLGLGNDVVSYLLRAVIRRGINVCLEKLIENLRLNNSYAMLCSRMAYRNRLNELRASVERGNFSIRNYILVMIPYIQPFY